jgi:hypothetical protein
MKTILTVGQLKQTLDGLPDDMPVWIWHETADIDNAYNTEGKTATIGRLIDDAEGPSKEYPIVMDQEDWQDEPEKQLFIDKGEVLLVG